MNLTLRFLFIAVLLVVTAHRLPAPIQEVPESPTPASEQGKSKKSSAKPKTKPAESDVAAKTSARSSSTHIPALQGAAKFAGAWTGTIGQPMGTSKVSLLFNATGTSVTFAGRERPAVIKNDGNTISWHSGLMEANVWTLTPNSDGKTAHVTVRGGMGAEWSATFTRDQGSQPSGNKAAAGQPAGNTTTSSSPLTEPTAKRVPDKPGFVYDPFDPNETTLLDVRGKASGSKVKEPLLGKIFIVP